MKTLKKSVALLLVLVMCLSLVNLSAFAGETTHEHNQDGWECVYTEPVTKTECKHTGHDETCGYAEAKPEVPCTCGAVADEETGEVVHEDGCAYTPAVPGEDCTHVCGEDCTTVVTEGYWTCTAPVTENNTPSYATQAELDAAFEAVGNVDPTSDDLTAFIAAMDAYLAVYSRLSPEDQAARAEEMAYVQSYRDQVAAGNPDEEVDPLALLVGEQFRIRVNYGYLENGQFHLLESKEMVSTCGYGCGHSGYNHTMNARAIVAASGYSGDWRVTRYGYWDSPASTTNCNYNITGSAPYKADQTIWVYGEKPTIEEPESPGTGNQPGTSGGSGSYFLQVVYVNKNKTEYTFGPRIASSTTTRSWYYYNDPVKGSAPAGYELKGWQSSHYHGTNNFLKNWWPINGSTYGLLETDQYNTTVVLSSGEGVYLIYQATKDPVAQTNTFTLTYDANGGKVNGKDSYVNSVETTDSSYGFGSIEPTRDGYNFLGWYTAKNGGSLVSWPKTLNTSNKTATVYAHWEPIPQDTAKAMVIYMPGEGSGYKLDKDLPGSQEYTVLTPDGAGITGPEGKVFSHWACTPPTDAGIGTGAKFFGGETITPKGNSTWIFTAVWKDDDSQTGDATYTVNWYDAETGNAIKTAETRRATLNSPVSVTEADMGEIVYNGYKYTFNSTDSRNLTAATLESTTGTQLKLYFIKGEEVTTTASYTVEWKDTLGNTLKAPETRNGTVGTTVSASSEDKSIDGYEYLSTKSTESAILASSGTTLTLVFQKKAKTSTQTVTLGVHFTKDTQAGSTVMPTLADIPANFTLKYSYTDADGVKREGTLNGSDARAWLDGANDNCPTLTWDNEDQLLKVKVAEGSPVIITLEEENYRIGDESTFIWTRSSCTDGGKIEEGTGQVKVNYASWDKNSKPYSYNYYKQPETPVTPDPKPVQDGTWQLDVTKEISNAYNLSGKDVTFDSLPDDFTVTVTVSYHDGTERVTETTTLSKGDLTPSYWPEPWGQEGSLTWNKVFMLPDWQFDFAGTGKTAADFTDYNTVITITEANYDVSKYTCTVGALVDTPSTARDGTTHKMENGTYTVTYPVQQSGANHTQSRFGLRNSYYAPAPVTPPEPETPSLEVKKEVQLVKAPDGTIRYDYVAQPGDTIQYQITVTNTGKTNVTGVVIVDELNEYLKFESATGTGKSWNSAPADGRYEFDKTLIAGDNSNNKVTLTITAKVKDNAPNGTISNIAIADCDGMPEDGKPSDTADVTVKPDEPAAPNLVITKTVDKASVKKGGTLTYTITVENKGSAEATNVVVKDTLPNGLSYVQGSGNPTPINMGQILTWGQVIPGVDGETITLAPNATWTATFKATANECGSLENTATVESTEVTTPVEPETPAKTTVFDLEVTKTNDGFMNADGTWKVDTKTGTATVRYTVTVTNNSGFALHGLDIIDTLKKPTVTSTEQGKTSVKLVLKPVSLKLGDADVGTLGSDITLSSTEASVNTWNVLPRSEEFADGATVTLVYDIAVQNTGETNVYVGLENTAKGGSWTTGNTVRARLRAAIAALSDDPGYDATDEATSGAEINTSGSGVVIPPATSVTITVKFVDEDGNVVSTEDVPVDKGSEYDVTDKATTIPKGYDKIVKTEGNPKGIADDDKTITVTVGKNTPVTPEKTHTVTWIDGHTNNQIDQVTVTEGETNPTAESRTAPTHSGYQFTSWSTSTDDNGNVTYTANYTSTTTGGGGGGGTTNRYTLTVNYVYAAGGEAAPSFSERHTSGWKYNVTSPVIEGYTADQTVVSGTLTRNTTITVRYTANEVDVGPEDPPLATQCALVVNYVYEDGTTAAPSYDEMVDDGAEYSVVSPVIEGYTPDKQVVAGKIDGVGVIVTVVYTKDPTDPEPEEPEDPVDLPDEQPPLVDLPDEQPPLVDLPDDPADPSDPSDLDGSMDIPDEQPPLVNLPDGPILDHGTDLPDEQPPLAGWPVWMDPITTIPEQQPPLAVLPSDPGTGVVDLPNEQPPLVNLPGAEQPGVDIPDEQPPLANVPATGDNSYVWTVLSVLSGLGLVWLVMTGKKRESEEQ